MKWGRLGRVEVWVQGLEHEDLPELVTEVLAMLDVVGTLGDTRRFNIPVYI